MSNYPLKIIHLFNLVNTFYDLFPHIYMSPDSHMKNIRVCRPCSKSTFGHVRRSNSAILIWSCTSPISLKISIFSIVEMTWQLCTVTIQTPGILGIGMVTKINRHQKVECQDIFECYTIPCYTIPL